MTQQTQTKQLTIVDTIRKMEPEFKAALPSHIPAERFVRNAVTVINANPELLGGDVDRRSVQMVCMKAAQHGLYLDGREAALVVFGGRASYIPMVEGIMKLVRNSGEVGVISVHVVKENDSFEYELGDNEYMRHKPARGNRGETIGAYSIVTLKDGSKSREWMDKDQIEAIRKRSRASGKGPWVTDYDEMCRKTVFRRHAKRLPKSTDIDDIIKDDDAETFDPPPDVVSISTPAAVAEKKQTRAEKIVKAEATEPEIVAENAIDIEYSDEPSVEVTQDAPPI